MSRKRGSTSRGTRIRWPRRFHLLADKLEDLRTKGEVIVHPEEAARQDPLPEVRHAACDRRRVVPAVPAAEGDRRRGSGSSCGRSGRRPSAMFGLMLVGVAMELAPPKLQQYLVDEILARARRRPMHRPCWPRSRWSSWRWRATRVLLGLVNWIKGVLANKVGVELTFELRSQLVRKLHALGVGYYDRHQVGSLVSRVAYDSEVLHSLLQQITGGFLLQIVQVIAVGIMLFTLNPKLALYMLIPTPLVVGGSIFFWRRVYPNYYRYWDSSSKQAGTLSGMLLGIRVVKAFAQEPREFDRFHRSSDYLQALAR